MIPMWPMFREISLSKMRSSKGENGIKEFSSLTGISLLGKIRVEYYSFEDEQCCDIRAFAKLNLREESALCISWIMKLYKA